MTKDEGTDERKVTIDESRFLKKRGQKMGKLRPASVLLIMLLLFPVQACTNSDNDKEAAVFKKQPELQMIRPQRPVNIKLKRNASGSYSWEVKGNDPDKVLEADEKLRKSLGKE